MTGCVHINLYPGIIIMATVNDHGEMNRNVISVGV
jgi:hypothetical protein